MFYVKWWASAGERRSEDPATRGLVEAELLDIRAGIEAGRYVNEATVSQGIMVGCGRSKFES